MRTFLAKYYHWIILFSLLIFFSTVAILSEGMYGGADNFSHYRISRYAFQYPILFLDHWGKPVFTILSSVFSLFGVIGVKFYNILIGLGTAYFIYKIALKLDIKGAWLSIFVVCFTPIYFVLIPSCLTEITFSFLFVLSSYLLINKNYIPSAIVLSFIYFTRSEGFIFFPIWILIYIVDKQYKAIVFLATSFILFGIIGIFAFGDFFWFINQIPYSLDSPYGSGDLLHFVKKYNLIIGKPIAGLYILGLLFHLFSLIKSTSDKRKWFIVSLCIYLPPVLFIAAHSYVWWKGLGGSLGLIRVMASITPLVAIPAVYGVNQFFDFIILNKRMKLLASLLVILFVVYYPFRPYPVPFKLDSENKTIKAASEWLVDYGINENKVYYYNPVFCHYLNIDPFDQTKAQEKINYKNIPSDMMEIGSYIEWDSHFGPNEGKMPLETLKMDSTLRIIKKFIPEDSLKLGGENYEVYIFQKQ